MRRAFSVAVFARRGGPGGRVLVIRHRRLGTWLPVGGELEPGETPLEAAARELREETGLDGRFPPLAGAAEGEPPGLLGYEEHEAGAKGLHLNFVFLADVADDAEPAGCDEYDAHRWVGAADLASLPAPRNVGQFAARALAARGRGPDQEPD